MLTEDTHDSAKEWKQYNGGRRWRPLESGQVESEGEGITRTGGYPRTMELVFQEYGSAIAFGAKAFDMPIPWVAAMITIEAARQRYEPRDRSWEQIRNNGNWSPLKNSKYGFLNIPNTPYEELPSMNGMRFDTISLRLEPGYVNQYDTPGRLSAGLFQCLYSTMLNMASKHDVEVFMRASVGGVEVSVPVELSLGDMMDPQRGAFFAAAYFADRKAAYSGGVEGHAFDFVHLVAAYNAGSIRPDDPETGNPYGMETYSKTRTVDAIKYLNDCYSPEILPLWQDASDGECGA